MAEEKEPKAPKIPKEPKAPKTPKTPKLTVDNPKVELTAGQKDKYGHTLVKRERVGTKVLDIWQSKSGNCIVAFAITDLRGSVVGKAKTLPEAELLFAAEIAKKG